MDKDEETKREALKRLEVNPEVSKIIRHERLAERYGWTPEQIENMSRQKINKYQIAAMKRNKITEEMNNE